MDILDLKNNGYHTSFHNVSDMCRLYPNCLFWGFLKYSAFERTALVDRNPLIIQKRGAFLNIGLDMNLGYNHRIYKNRFTIDDELILFDFDVINTANWISLHFIGSLIYAQNIGILLQENDHPIDFELYNLLFKNTLQDYWTDSKIERVQHTYIKRMLSCGFSIPFFVQNLKEEYKVIVVSRNHIDDTTDIDFKEYNRDFIYFNTPLDQLNYFIRCL